jgi:single-strand DNA-binding protein
MDDLNSVIIEGKLIEAPVLHSSPKGMPVCTFRLASTRFYREDNSLVKEVNYFDIESRGKLAESCQKLGYKGRGARAVGRLRQECRDDSDGKARPKIIIIAEHVEFRPDLKRDETPESNDETLG